MTCPVPRPHQSLKSRRISRSPDRYRLLFWSAPGSRMDVTWNTGSGARFVCLVDWCVLGMERVPSTAQCCTMLAEWAMQEEGGTTPAEHPLCTAKGGPVPDLLAGTTVPWLGEARPQG